MHVSLPFRSGREWSCEARIKWANDESEIFFLEKLETTVKKWDRSWELLISFVLNVIYLGLNDN